MTGEFVSNLQGIPIVYGKSEALYQCPRSGQEFYWKLSNQTKCLGMKECSALAYLEKSLLTVQGHNQINCTYNPCGCSLLIPAFMSDTQ